MLSARNREEDNYPFDNSAEESAEESFEEEGEEEAEESKLDSH